MKASEARKVLANLQIYHDDNDSVEALSMAIEALKKRPHGEWIPCSERLPEESLNSVIGWDNFRHRCVFVQYINGHWGNMGINESFDIIAWMPLPEPYQKEGEQE